MAEKRHGKVCTQSESLLHPFLTRIQERWRARYTLGSLDVNWRKVRTAWQLAGACYSSRLPSCPFHITIGSAATYTGLIIFISAAVLIRSDWVDGRMGEPST